MVPVISIVGFHDSGKTTIVEQVIRRLTERGWRVGTVKHSAHDFEIDQPGKDSWRHRAAGATTVVIAGGGAHALISRLHAELPRLLRYFDKVDVILTEGYKSAGKPKLEVYSRAIRETGDPLLALDDPSVFGVVADDVPLVKQTLARSRPDVCVFARDDYEGVTQFVVQRLLTPMQQLVGVILAGGKSTRMGRDKAFVKLGVETLIQRQVRRLRQVTREVIVVTRQPAKFRDMEVRCVTDSPLGMGPLAGLHAGLKSASGRPCLVVAVDMPFVNLDLAVYQALLLHVTGKTPKPQVIVPRHDGHYQPLHAVYDSTCLPLIETVFADNAQAALHSLFDVARVRALDTGTIQRFADPDLCFFNTNTPEQLARADELLAGPHDAGLD